MRDEHPGSHVRELRNNVWGLKYYFFDADPGSGIFLTLDPVSGIRDGKIRIREPGSRINIKDPKHCSTAVSPMILVRSGRETSRGYKKLLSRTKVFCTYCKERYATSHLFALNVFSVGHPAEA
jgi:hypothetical protein